MTPRVIKVISIACQIMQVSHPALLTSKIANYKLSSFILLLHWILHSIQCIMNLNIIPKSTQMSTTYINQVYDYFVSINHKPIMFSSICKYLIIFYALLNNLNNTLAQQFMSLMFYDFQNPTPAVHCYFLKYNLLIH